MQTDYKGGLDACVISSPPSPPNSKTGKGKKHIGYEEKNSENCGIVASNLPPSSAPVPSFRLRPVPNVVLLPCRTQMNLARQWHDDSTAAVSNVEPNAVAPNSKDKTNHPSSGIAPSKMAEGNLNEEREKFVLFKTILNARRQRRRICSKPRFIKILRYL